MRLQLALNVSNLEESIAFYSNLFDAEPAKIKPGYANFTPTGIGFGNDSQCYGAASPYHAP